MSSRRFMIDSRCIVEGSALLGGELFRHIVRVLRLAPGEGLTLVDETGCEHAGVIGQIAADRVTISISQSSPLAESEASRLRITLCQALPKGEKIDLILQKGTELGVHDFWLFCGQRSVARISDGKAEPKLQRWGRIVSEAARQCGRRTIPAVRWFPSAADAAGSAQHEKRLILREDERTNRLKGALEGRALQGSLIVAIGPEGGFSPAEAASFSGNGFESVSLGSRILRTETAAIAIASIIQYISGDI